MTRSKALGIVMCPSTAVVASCATSTLFVFQQGYLFSDGLFCDNPGMGQIVFVALSSKSRFVMSGQALKSARVPWGS